MAATILYLDTIPGERIQNMTLAGIRRYAAARGWDAVAVPREESRPAAIPALLAARKPVAGCVVECSDGRSDLPPRLFGRVPVVYLHAAPSLYGGRGMRVNADNAAIAAAAFRELSAGRPDAYAVVGFRGRRTWSEERERTFLALAKKAGKPCETFRRRNEEVEEKISRLVPWLAALPRKCAIFAVNDLTMAEVAEAARKARRAIPGEFTLVGVDNNVAMCDSFRPTLSSIQIDHERAGYVAARMLATGGAGDNAALFGPLSIARRQSTRGSGRLVPHILKAVEIIRREACDGLTAAALAARMPGSRRLLEMRFREMMGHSVLDEIMHVRMEKVKTLLAQTGTSIDAIAGLCGFGSEIRLRHAFLDCTGLSMREWRKRNRT